MGIAVDPRRQNLSEEGLAANVARLAEYKKRLILFPRRAGRPRAGDAAKEEVAAARRGEGVLTTLAAHDALAIANVVEVQEVSIADVEGEENAYRKLRTARSDARLVGVREKRAKAKAEEAASAKK